MSDVTPDEIEAGAAVISRIEWAKVGVTQTAAIGRGDRYAAEEVLAAVLPLFWNRKVTELADEIEEVMWPKRLYEAGDVVLWLESKVGGSDV